MFIAFRYDSITRILVLNKWYQKTMAPSVQAGSRYTVERFDGTGNFADWQARMEGLLTTLGLWDTLQEKKPDDLQDRAWEKELVEAVSNIRMCVSTGVRNHLTGLKTPKEIWTKLESLYQAKTLTSKIYAQQAFYGLRMQEGGDLVNHLTVFNNALAELTRLGIKVDDEVKAVVLLCSLPPSYAHLVTTLTYGKDTVKLDDISSTLLAHEQRSRSVAEKGGSGDGLFVKGGAERGRGKEQGESSGKKKIHNIDRTQKHQIQHKSRNQKVSTLKHVETSKRNPDRVLNHLDRVRLQQKPYFTVCMPEILEPEPPISSDLRVLHHLPPI